MQWSYHMRSTTLATTSKFKMAAIFETSHLFSRRYTFFTSFPRPMFSRVPNAMKLSFLFYDHCNYLKLLWELQIDVSIIYSFILILLINSRGMSYLAFHWLWRMVVKTSNINDVMIILYYSSSSIYPITFKLQNVTNLL